MIARMIESIINMQDTCTCTVHGTPGSKHRQPLMPSCHNNVHAFLYQFLSWLRKRIINLLVLVEVECYVGEVGAVQE